MLKSFSRSLRRASDRSRTRCILKAIWVYVNIAVSFFENWECPHFSNKASAELKPKQSETGGVIKANLIEHLKTLLIKSYALQLF